MRASFFVVNKPDQREQKAVRATRRASAGTLTESTMPKRHYGKATAIAIIAMAATGRFAFGQNPSTSAPDSLLPIYRPPRIALVQPAAGGVLPQDRPVIVIRFVAGELNDPVDAGSFAVSVDARDQSKLFQVSATEAWGPITAVPSELSLGGHDVAARICSVRGACSNTVATITVAKPAVAVAEPSAVKAITRKKRVMDALLGVLRTLLKQ